MEWTDLEIGDKVKIREEVINQFKDIYPDWAKHFYNNILEITIIKPVDGNGITIFFNPEKHDPKWSRLFDIRKDGTVRWANDKILFEVVELKGD
jgi:hypothetical protein